MKRAALIAAALYALVLVVAVDDDPFMWAIHSRLLEWILMRLGVSW